MWTQTEASLFETAGREAFVAARARRAALVARMMPVSQGQRDLDAVQNSVCLFQDALAQLGDVEDEWDVLLLLNMCECVVKECRDTLTLVALATDTTSVKKQEFDRLIPPRSPNPLG